MSPAAAQRALAKHPKVRSKLDSDAVAALLSAEPARSVEIVEILAELGKAVKNPSSFVVRALKRCYRHSDDADEWYGKNDEKHVKRNRARRAFEKARAAKAPKLMPLEALMANNPKVTAALDAEAITRLRTADQERAIEIFEDLLLEEGEIWNQSAFICTALARFPRKRGNANAYGTSASRRSEGGSAPTNKKVKKALAHHKDVLKSLDAGALQKLGEVEPSRAIEIIEDLAAKHDEVHNISAFIVRALNEHPTKRGGSGEDQRARNVFMLPKVLASLDDRVVERLAEANPERAAEILEDLVAKGGEVRNPSAFVARALNMYGTKRRGRKIVESESESESEEVMAYDTTATSWGDRWDDEDSDWDNDDDDDWDDEDDDWDDRGKRKNKHDSWDDDWNARKWDSWEKSAKKSSRRSSNKDDDWDDWDRWERMDSWDNWENDARTDAKKESRKLSRKDHKREIRRDDEWDKWEKNADWDKWEKDSDDDEWDRWRRRTQKDDEWDKWRKEKEWNSWDKWDSYGSRDHEVVGKNGESRRRSAPTRPKWDDDSDEDTDDAPKHRRAKLTPNMATKLRPTIRSVTSLAQALALLEGARVKLDSKVHTKLKEVEAPRAIEIIEDLVAKRAKVQKPSAFVMKALTEHPKKRNAHNAENILALYPEVVSALDVDVVRRLRYTDPARAEEILEDLAAKTDVRNPSAFAMKALKMHPDRRSKAKEEEPTEGKDNDEFLAGLRLPPPPGQQSDKEILTTKGQLKPPPPQNLPPNKNIFVEGLPRGTNEEQVRKAFAQVGQVVWVKLSQDEQRNLTAYVRMKTLRMAADAIMVLNNTPLSNKNLDERLICRFYGEDRNTVIIKGLCSTTCSEKFVKNLFSRFGQVRRCKVIPPGTAALVQMVDADEAMQSVKGLNHTYLDDGRSGRQALKPRMQVRYAEDKREEDKKEDKRIESPVNLPPPRIPESAARPKNEEKPKDSQDDDSPTAALEMLAESLGNQVLEDTEPEDEEEGNEEEEEEDIESEVEELTEVEDLRQRQTSEEDQRRHERREAKEERDREASARRQARKVLQRAYRVGVKNAVALQEESEDEEADFGQLMADLRRSLSDELGALYVSRLTDEQCLSKRENLESRRNELRAAAADARGNITDDPDAPEDDDKQRILEMMEHNRLAEKTGGRRGKGSTAMRARKQAEKKLTASYLCKALDESWTRENDQSVRYLNGVELKVRKGEKKIAADVIEGKDEGSAPVATVARLKDKEELMAQPKKSKEERRMIRRTC